MSANIANKHHTLSRTRKCCCRQQVRHRESIRPDTLGNSATKQPASERQT